MPLGVPLVPLEKVAKTRAFVVVACLLLISLTGAGTISPAPAHPFNAAPTTWTMEDVDPSGAIDSSDREADDSTADDDERQLDNAGESYGRHNSAAVPPLAIALNPAIDGGDLAPIEPTQVIAIHAPPTRCST
jgi:hypothetical protein